MWKVIAGLLSVLVCLPLVYAQSPLTADDASAIQMLGVLQDTDGRLHDLMVVGETVIVSREPRNAPFQLVQITLADQSEDVLWESEQAAATALALSPDGAQLAFWTGDRVLLLDLPSEEFEALYTADTDLEVVHSLAFSPDGMRLAAGRVDGSIILIDPQMGTVRTTLPTLATTASDRERQQEAVTRVLFARDGRLYSAHASGWLRVWDITQAEPIRAWQAHEAALTALALSPDEAQLATSGADQQVRVWAGDTLRHSLSANATSVTFSPDGALLVAGGKTLYIWQAGEPLYANFHADRDVSAAHVQFTADGTHLITGSRQIAVWGLEPGAYTLIPVVDDRLAVGEDLYMRNACNTCHAEYDSGAPSLYLLSERAPERIPGMSAEAYSYEAIVDPDAFVVAGYPRAIHPSYYSEKMSPEEITMLVEYLLSLRPR